MNKFTKIISLSAASFALSIGAYAQDTGNSATTTETSAMGSTDHSAMGHSEMGHDKKSVKKAQEQLRSKGHPVGRIDGQLGPRTSQALRDFQSSQGLSATGQLDSQTMAALRGESTGDTGMTTGTTSGSTIGDDTTMGTESERQGRSPTDTTDSPVGTGTGTTEPGTTTEPGGQ